MSEDSMAFPNTWEEFEKQYGFTDTEEIYTNGTRLIPSFRVEQWLEHLQAVPVIHCRECKYRDEQSANCTRFRKDWYVQSNSFCSWAKRKEE